MAAATHRDIDHPADLANQIERLLVICIVIRQIKDQKLICPVVAVMLGNTHHIAIFKQFFSVKAGHCFPVFQIHMYHNFLLHYKLPFVESTSVMRLSIPTAMSSAFANALNIASII